MFKLVRTLEADLYRYAGRISFLSFIDMYCNREGYRFTVWLRLCHYLRQHKLTKYVLFPFAKFVYKHYKYKYGYDIPYTCEIGPGLLIFHIGGITFSPKSCGKNLTLSQNTTVGMTIHEGVKSFPVLGDNVYLAPGSAVIGGITVGNGVAIGTNCVLTKSVSDYSVVVGIPGKVISSHGSKPYVNNPI